MDFNGRVELSSVCERAERRKAQNRAAQRKFRSRKKALSMGDSNSPPSIELNVQAEVNQSSSSQFHSIDYSGQIASNSDQALQSPPTATASHSDTTSLLPVSTCTDLPTTTSQDDTCQWPEPEFPNMTSEMAGFNLLGLCSPYTPSSNPTNSNGLEVPFYQGLTIWPPGRSALSTPFMPDIRGPQAFYSHDDGSSSSSSQGVEVNSRSESIEHPASRAASNAHSRPPSAYRTWSEPSSWNSPRLPPSEHQYPAGPESSSSGPENWNLPLHIATEKGHECIVKALIESGVDVNERDSAGCTALHIAVRYKQEGLLKILLENGSDVDAQDSSGWTPVHTAADNGFSVGLRLLLEYGGSLTRKARKRKSSRSLGVYC